MKYRLFLCGLFLVFLSPSSVFADTIFNYSFNSVVVHGQPGLPYGGSGQFDAVETSTAGIYTIVGATGTVSSFPIGTNAITGISGYGTLVSSNGNVSLDGIGLLFNNGELGLGAGNVPSLLLNTGYLAYLDYYVDSTHYGSEVASADLTITEALPPVASTPEPGTFVLLGTGLLGVANALRRRLIC